MEAKRKTRLLKAMRSWLRRRSVLSPELQRGKELLAAIDAGGIPLNPAIVNQIARNLGLEVSRDAPMEETIPRIRAAVARATDTPSPDGGLR